MEKNNRIKRTWGNHVFLYKNQIISVGADDSVRPYVDLFEIDYYF